jgi:hypothetical protein
MSASRSKITVRSYHGVVDRVERRIFRFERWRLPTPYGVAVRALVYTGVAFCAVALCSALPPIGLLLGVLPWALHWFAIPLAAGWALSTWEPDGRPPHYALRSALRFWVCPRRVAGLRPRPAVGTTLAPLDRIQIAPSGDEPRYRRGRVRGPARVLLRYPARITYEGARGRGRKGGLTAAKRVRVRPPTRPGRPLPVGATVEVPAGRELVIG